MNLNEQIVRIRKMMGLLNEGDSEITWEPLYKFLEPIFGEKYEKVANGFMYMNMVGELYYYKNGLTRKGVLLDMDGNPYKRDDKGNFTRVTVSDAFNRIFEDYRMFIKQMEDDGHELSDEQKKDIYTMSYSEYRDWRDNFLTRKGYNVSTVSGDNFKDFHIPGN